jgi:hypothetical protein
MAVVLSTRTLNGDFSCVQRDNFSMALRGAVDLSRLCRYGHVLTSECHENYEGKE